MATLSNTNVLVRLPSGNRAVYTVEPQHLPRENLMESLDWPILYGRQVAHELGGRWYRPDGWTEVTDPKLITLFERCPEV
jgi:hypothetical protein